MNRDKDEFWAITDPDGRLLPGTSLTRRHAINNLCYWKASKWDALYRQGYRARRVRVEVI